MVIDCTTCALRDVACGDCVVSHFLSLQTPAPARHELPDAEVRALRVLQGAGMLPPLRMAAEEGRAAG